MNDAGAVSTAPRACSPTRHCRAGCARSRAAADPGLLGRLQPGPAARRHQHAAGARAGQRALHVEGIVGIQWEVALNRLFTDHRVLGLVGELLVRHRSTTSSPPPCWSGCAASAPTATAPRAAPWRSAPCSRCSPTSGADGAAAAARRVRRRAQPARRRRLVGRRRLRAARAGRAHQRARRVPVDARRLGALGRARAADLRHPQVGARARLGLRRSAPRSSSSAPATTG